MSVVFSGYSGFPPPIKLYDIAEILLKVVLNTIALFGSSDTFI
jgi:hypothetical protein